MTMTTERNTQDDLLDGLFADSRATAPVLPDDLRARILADAESVLAPLAPRPRPAVSLRSLFSGWLPTSLAGGLTAAAAGFWLGVVATPLPLAALDMPIWVEGALDYIDTVTLPLLGTDDPFLAGY
jgi:hypothetical protein